MLQKWKMSPWPVRRFVWEYYCAKGCVGDMLKKTRWNVFLPPFLFLLACVVFNFIDTNKFTEACGTVYNGILQNFGWANLAGPFCMIIALLYVYFSPLGEYVIGGKNAKPLFDKRTWFFIALCTTIACGIVFWAAAEPLQHYLYPPESLNIEPASSEAAVFSMTVIFTHYTLMPYATYTIVTVMFAFAYYNMKKKFSIGSCLAPFVPEKHEGKVGIVVDVIAIFALCAGLAASLGIGVLNINGALTNMLGLPSNSITWLVIIVCVTAFFVLSAISGIVKGIKVLSDMNVYLYLFLIALIFLCGGTVFILEFGLESIAKWLSTFFERCLFTGASTGDPWSDNWTIFYMGNWFAWAPITGVFLGRISRGRKVKEVIKVNLFATSIFCMIWFIIISGATLNFAMHDPDCGLIEAFNLGYENAIYCLLDNLPLAAITKVLFFIAVVISFITAADSNTVAIAGLCCNSDGEEDPESPAALKILWGVIISAVTWIMMSVGDGMTGIKILSNVGGFPAMILVICIMFALIRVARSPEKYNKVE